MGSFVYACSRESFMCSSKTHLASCLAMTCKLTCRFLRFRQHSCSRVGSWWILFIVPLEGVLEWYAVATCLDVRFEDLNVRCKRTDNRCPILSSLSAPDGNQQGPCIGFPLCSPWQAVHAHSICLCPSIASLRGLDQVSRFVMRWGMLTSVRCKIGWFVWLAESIRIKAHQNVFWWASDSGSWAVSICLFSWVVHVQQQGSCGIISCNDLQTDLQILEI